MKEVKSYKYKFSVIIPVYNVEQYLVETIDSVISQTIGFKKNIQMIIVNDGSPDNSEKICLEYAKKYPENIKYVYQENAGVSAARNNGLNYVEGKYINFLDSDDMWQKDVFKKAWNMFEENEDVDVIGVRQKFFEAAKGYHALDFKFDRDKVIDIHKEYNHIQLSVTSGFFRASAIGNIRYDTRVKYSEDSKFVNEVLIKKGKLGIIASSVHLYRKRYSENSAIQTKNFKDDWYIITPELCYKHAFDLSKKKFGKVIPYMQYYVAYDYQFRLKQPIPNTISDKSIEKYKKITKELFDEIDDKIMFEQIDLPFDYKIEYLKIKYGKDIVKDFVIKSKDSITGLFYKDLYVQKLEEIEPVNITIMNFKSDQINIKGLVQINLPKESYKINLVINDKKRINLDLQETRLKGKMSFDYIISTTRGFDITISSKELKSMYFELEYKDGTRGKVGFCDGIYSKISSKSRIYYIHDNLIFYVDNSEIRVQKKNIKNKLYFSLRNLKFNIANKKLKVIIIRMAYSIMKMMKRKDIWILTDRPDSANDNGFALFKYLQKNPVKNVNTYFAINKNSDSLEKAKKEGKVIYFNSFLYKVKFLLADKIISSQADGWTENPFGKAAIYYKDLYNHKFYFLQHGITQNDLSPWLNKYQKKFSLFVTATEKEYDSIVNGDYEFGKDVVKLTGFPRYDLLSDHKEKIVTIMPTWRKGLSTNVTIKTGKRGYNPTFKESDYFKFYNNLINDERLIKCMKKNKYKGQFIVHSGHAGNKDEFKANSVFEIKDNTVNYSEVFSKSALVVTDFSSVAFDFAYLNKPVIYTQFDKDTFFENQIYDEGYFSYEKDGLGPVIYDYEKTVAEIIKYIENDCKLEEKYRKRIKKLYKFNDKNNCKRVVEEIIK